MAAPSIRPVNVISQFIGATASDLNATIVPFPIDALVIDVSTGNVKMGDGTTLYVDLPVLFNFRDLVNINSALANKADITHTHTPTSSGLSGVINNGSVLNNNTITVSPWTPDRTVNEVQYVTFNTASMTINVPTLGPDIVTSKLVLFMRTTRPGGTLLNLGPNCILVNGGSVLLNGGIYVAEIDIAKDLFDNANPIKAYFKIIRAV